MSKPESIKVDPWTEWPRQSYSLINDDFVHDKLATFKVNAKGAKSTVNLKANIKADKAGLKLTDEVKYWFNLPEGRSFYSCLLYTSPSPRDLSTSRMPSSA